MSARTTTDGGLDDETARTPTCTAPSCWEPAEPVEIVGDDVKDEPVLCDVHRRAYLGVST